MCFCSFAGVSNRNVHPWYVHVYVPESDEVSLGRFEDVSAFLSLFVDSMVGSDAGKPGVCCNNVLFP